MPHADQALHEVLLASQRSGFLGDRPIDQVIEHARHFVHALDSTGSTPNDALDATVSVIDLGAGGGVPGLVLANDRPDLELTLLDRRAKRTDFLERMVRRLGWSDRVTVVCSDIDRFTPPRPFDAAVARGFGPPSWTLRVATELVRSGGRVVISDPPDADRWSPELLQELGVERRSPPGTPVVVFRRH